MGNAKTQQRFKEAYIKTHVRIAELSGEIEEMLENRPHPDIAEVNWGLIGDLSRVVESFEQAAQIMRGTTGKRGVR